ncbi:sacsin N-terminal ATP-binding-like domain-containing protein [Amycolatopsis aidingensis]|uniref:sacsin N-terminal ATP-binding-like domain-containing protein n=1 Tax=Amycolatopsis aidingensis TaxID=2842453 RepID=UPI001E549085|nr:molecular chaperone Hsp90 [Amycolatopsis aidingensis]
MPLPATEHTPEPFGIEGLRSSVLRAWRDSPTRFTEDTNAEHDLRVGGYRDRLFVELAQNAADAAALAGTPGRLRVGLAGRELRVANTGAPLDAAGVAALASLRASAKPEGTVGRFGVGFAAVLAVCTEPRVVSSTGGVAFSAARTVAATGAEGAVPVLRLPWPLPPDEPAPPEDFDTEVRLPLAEGVDPAGLLDRLATEVPDLLLALPWLDTIEVAGSRWRRTDLGAGLLELTGPDGAGRRWLTHVVPGGAARWAVPVDESGAPLPLEAGVLHAPTPTDERLSLPARLIATLPIEPSRRRVLPGAAATAVLESAAQGYPELVRVVAPEHRLALVPSSGFPLSEVDDSLRELVLAALRREPWLPAAAGGTDLPGGRARVLEAGAPGLVESLAEVLPGLVAAPLCGHRAAAVAARAGATGVGTGELIEAVTGISRPPGWWHRLYTALLAAVDGGRLAMDELGALPVPLVDGRTLPGPRGALLADTGTGPLDLLSEVDIVGLRVVHPDAEHPLLERLGARQAGAADLLTAPELREAVERSAADALSGMDVGPLAEVVLRLLAESGPGAGGGLGALALPAGSGWRRAEELVLPGAGLLAVLDPEALGPEAPLEVLDAEFAARWPEEVLTGAGVLTSFAVVTDEEPAGPEHELPEEADWWDAVEPSRVHAVRDLDLVADEAWPAALRLLAANPETWRALTEPGGHTGWWIARYALLAGQAPAQWRLPEATALAGLYDPVPDLGLRADLLRAAGVRAGLVPADAEDAAELLDRLGDPEREVPPGLAARAHAALADAELSPDELDPPERVRTLEGAVADAERAMVLDRPWPAAVLPARRLVAVPGWDRAGRLAELLDLPLAGECVVAGLSTDGEYVDWAEMPAVRLAAELLGIDLPAGGVVVHDRLTVTVEGQSHEVTWWCAEYPHAEDSSAGLAAALAWAAGRWGDRHLLAALLDDPTATTLLT